MPDLVQISDAVKSYGAGPGQVQALAGVDATIHDRELTLVLGASGSGKSTLLNMLGGLDRLTAGEVEVQGHRLTTMNDAQLTDYRRRVVGFVFQFYNLITSLTALENVALAAQLVVGARASRKVAAELIDRVGLGARAKNFPGQLSGGEMQRVAIARALAKSPALLLCDEPTGALDAETGRRIMDLLRQTAEGCAVIVVTHNPDFTRQADQVIRLADGRVIPRRAAVDTKAAS